MPSTDRSLTLSAEPLVGLKLEDSVDATVNHDLSAEPLVGLKLEDSVDATVNHDLSAEPLVGLKRGLLSFRVDLRLSFSRTPRGFEAISVTATSNWSTPFQPNPSWV